MSNTHELAWAAGFFDGEGYVGWRRGNRHSDPKRRTYMGIVANVAQKTPELLKRFCKIVGVGKVYGPYVNGRSGTNKRHYSFRFNVSSYEDVEFLGELLFPYLGTKRQQQFTEAIHSWRTMPRRTKRRYDGIPTNHADAPDYRGVHHCTSSDRHRGARDIRLERLEATWPL